ncbi:TPA: carbohydrate ABC transporter permease, partial [Candidatus Micrarchaeota archaeon]|nr:carbohydrate ABC transporter permease [Candidatus Micrarchaeota archaeon]
MSFPWVLRRTLLYMVALTFALWVLIPIFFIGISAFTPRNEIYKWPKTLIPSRFSLETMDFFLNSYGVLRSLQNSVWVALLTLAFTLAVGVPAGYAVARFRFRGRDGFRMGILITRMFPTALLAVPLAVTFIRWRLYDTLIGVALIHTAMSLPFAVIITTGIFMGVPKDLEEAAMTLGCSRLGAFIRVALPLALPGLAAGSTVSPGEAIASFSGSGRPGGPGPHLHISLALISSRLPAECITWT